MKLLYFLAAFSLLVACNTAKKATYPPETGFDIQQSDAKAIAIADEVMQAMGGYKNWQTTRYIKWNFMGSRMHTWDKWTGDIRIDYEKEDLKILMNIHTMEGKAMVGDTLIDANNPRNHILMQKGKAHWINDSYWLVMPFKLKDSGVTLKYNGTAKTKAGQNADVLALTFKNTGLTPNNKYLIYVDSNSRLVTQWDFYTNVSDENPRFQIPWENYQQHGKIQLSGGRGKYTLSDIAVSNDLASSIFSAF